MVQNNVDHYFSAKPASPFTPKIIIVAVRGVTLVLTTSGGTFSSLKLDNGTRLLIESAQVKKGNNVLDLGCGYGAVGIAVAKAVPGTTVCATDINERAVMLTKENAKKNDVEIDARHGDGYSAFASEMFDVILLNPPQTAGKKVCERLIIGAKERLASGGSLQIVARHNKGGASLSKTMEETFGNLEVIARESGYRVYRSILE